MEDLLNLQQMREGTFDLVRQPFDVYETLKFVVDMFQIKAKAYDVSIFFTVQPELQMPNS